MYLRRLFSVQNVFTDTNGEIANKSSIVCEPKGVVYEYVYDNAELRGGMSATLALIVEVGFYSEQPVDEICSDFFFVK